MIGGFRKGHTTVGFSLSSLQVDLGSSACATLLVRVVVTETAAVRHWDKTAKDMDSEETFPNK